jgi:hypothetical protein
LVVGAPVYTELLAYPKATESFVNSFLADTGIDVDFEFLQRVWLEAGGLHGTQSGDEEQRNKSRGACLLISSLDRMPRRRRIVSWHSIRSDTNPLDWLRRYPLSKRRMATRWVIGARCANSFAVPAVHPVWFPGLYGFGPRRHAMPVCALRRNVHPYDRT